MFNSAYPTREKIFSLCHINYINCYIIRINYNPRTESRVDLCGGIFRARFDFSRLNFIEVSDTQGRMMR